MMALSANRRMTLEEYLNYEDGTDIRYEVHDGVLVEMGAESDVNVLIAPFCWPCSCNRCRTIACEIKQKLSCQVRAPIRAIPI